MEESSSDSDFRIEDHDDDSDDYSVNSGNVNAVDNDEASADDDSSADSADSDQNESRVKKSGTAAPATSNGPVSTTTTNQLLELVRKREATKLADLKLMATPICCACLGERSDDTNEIVECDGCGVTVHEGCYGVSESVSVSSTVSSCSTEPWFCEACKAGVPDPVCELCPNKGGIFKETDVGKWVHLVCALYIPGVAFGEVDQLSAVTLFEMQYSKWGSKVCSLCEEATFARTGVCIGCDAGMCKNYFHVTCAQSNGLLSEAHSEEADHADPFYAHCKLHSDKTLIKRRRRNFNALRMRGEHRREVVRERALGPPSAEAVRIERKLKKHKTKYGVNKTVKNEPWVPTQKMPRLLTTSASARRRLMYKAQLMGIDTTALEVQETQIAALVDIRKKWHIPPAFSVEFIAYYLDRIVRLTDIKTNLKVQIESNKELLESQQTLRARYDEEIAVKEELVKGNAELRASIAKLHASIQSLCPNKVGLPAVDLIGKDTPLNFKPAAPPASKPMTVPTAAALKMGVGFPLNNLPGTVNNSGRVLSTQRPPNDALLHDCGICKKCTDQHLLAKCDTCHFYYHLGCLNPPLTRHPKKSKLYGWQCSECDKSDDSEPDITLPKAQRRSRVRYSKDGFFLEKADDSSSVKDELISPPQSVKTVNQSQSIEESVTDLSLTSADDEKFTVKSPDRKRMKNTKTVVVELKKLDAATVKGEMLVVPVVDKPPVEPESVRASVATPVPPQVAETTKQANPTEVVKETESQSSSVEDLAAADKAVSKRDKKLKKFKRMQSESAASIATIIGDQPSPPPPSTSTTDNNKTASYESTSSTYLLPQFTSEIITDGGGDNVIDGSSLGIIGGVGGYHIKNRKRKKDKHKSSKHSPESDRSASVKEHKRKHKRKDMECSQEISEEGPHPRIKIKFKAIHMPTNTSGDSKSMIYVAQNDEVAAAAATTVTDATTNVIGTTSSPPAIGIIDPLLINTPPAAKKVKKSSVDGMRSPAKLQSPPPPSTILSTSPRRKSLATKSAATVASTDAKKDTKAMACDVCHQPGIAQNLVCCDECRRTYHFSCLDPPLKKSPKRRGYSWHCADCDPTVS